MKKVVLFLMLVSFVQAAQAQNIQFITNGKINIATFEIYKSLEHGAMYYFTDFKMSKNGYTEAYSEISKYWNIGKVGALTLQYNAGLNETFHIFPVYLGGVSKSFTIGKTFNLEFDLMYRHQNFLYLGDKEKHDGYQLTTIFSESFGKFQFSGYCDYWNFNYFIFEPQGWYKFSKRVYAGLEWRLSNYDDVLNYDMQGNFIGKYAKYLMFGFKWDLE
jgi:hypothetical protein